jgi:hypothetical protein
MRGRMKRRDDANFFRLPSIGLHDLKPCVHLVKERLKTYPPVGHLLAVLSEVWLEGVFKWLARSTAARPLQAWNKKRTYLPPAFMLKSHNGIDAFTRRLN